jgi:predicted nuclease of predicted toxin-antitoxin system
MTRLLLNENFPHSAVRGLEQAGHDVQSVAAEAPGLDDAGVLALAREQQRGLVTFDSDFGDLVFQHGAEPPLFIMYLRLHPIDPEEALALTLQALNGPHEGLFIVVTARGLRRRPFVPLTGHARPGTSG